MNSIHLASCFIFALALAACGGTDFTTGDRDAGEAGAAGDVDPGSGGSSAGAGDTGGSAGSGPAGSGAGGAGTGGAAAGSAGSSSAGSAGSAATGTGGEPAGGTGGGAPSCAPEEAIVVSAIPETFTWGGFAGRFDDGDQSYCASSDGAVCSFRNLELSVHDGGDSATVMFYLMCQPQPAFRAGVCGSEMPCDTTIDQTAQVTAIFTITVANGRYRLGDVSGRAAIPWLLNERDCSPELPGGGYAPAADDADQDFGAELSGMFQSLEFACP